MSDMLPKAPKIGNHSVYVWGAVLGVALLAYTWYARRSSSGSSSSTDSTTTPDTSATTDPTLTSGPLGSNNGYTDNSFTPDSGSTDTSVPDPTNQSWEAKAIAYLVSVGIPAESAQVAVEQYLAGYKTSYQGHLWLNRAIAHLGPAPEGTEAIPGWNAKHKPKPAKSTHKPKRDKNKKPHRKIKRKPKRDKKPRRKIVRRKLR